MAQKKGITLRMDNSDDAQREFEITCEVAVEQGKAQNVRALNVSKDGVSVAYGNVSRLDSDTPSLTLNIQNTPIAGHRAVLDAVYDFVAQVVEQVNEEV